MADTNRIHDIEQIVHGNKVKTSFIAAPNTQIVGADGQARRIPDLENNLKVSLGIERIMSNKIRKISNEFGLAGQSVYESETKDSRLRLVGDWVNNYNTTGVKVQSNGNFDNPSNFIEITFYGTGLNVLGAGRGGTIQSEVVVDGGSSTLVNLNPSTNAVLSGRNYEPNIIIPIVKGLALGLHTIKIPGRIGNSDLFYFYGFEVVNESAQLIINPGQPFVGGFANNLDTQTLVSIVPSSIAGTKGARVVTYIDSDGVVQQATQETAGTALFLSASDHSTEDVLRRVNYKEFGRNRGDDFSTLSTGVVDRAYTLDDNMTYLVGDDVRDGSFDAAAFPNGGVYVNSSGTTGRLVFNFVGTGLDWVMSFGNSPETITVFVDNVNVGTLNYDNNEKSVLRKICSGLPYGTHSVRLERGGGSSQWVAIEDFIVYGPKKPALPENITELADYNVVSDFVFNSGTSPESNSEGMIYVDCSRGLATTGTWSYLQNSFNIRKGGANIESGTNGATIEYTFFGTGIGYNFGSFNAHTSNSTMEIDGVLVTDANFGASNIDFKGTGSSSFDGGTGVLNQNSGGSNGTACLSVKNLSLGLHTVKITNNAAATITCNGFEIITPIHINSSDFKVGPLSLKDVRRNNTEAASSKAVDFTKLKAFIVYDETSGEIKASYNISAVYKDGVFVWVYFKQPFKDRYSYGATMMVGDYQDASNDVGQVSPVEIYANYMKLRVTQDGTGNDLADFISLCFFGELEDETSINLKDL